MARKICITEKQDNMALKEGVTIAADTKNGIENGVKDAAYQAKQKGLKPDDFSVSVDGASADGISEGRLISKKDLQKSRLRALKENSEVYTVRDFMKMMK